MGKEVSVAASSPQQQRWENPERERESARGRERESICYRETLLPPRPLSTVHRIWFQIVFQFRYRPKDKVQNHRIRIKSSYSFDLFAYHNYKNRVFEYIWFCFHWSISRKLSTDAFVLFLLLGSVGPPSYPPSHCQNTQQSQLLGVRLMVPISIVNHIKWYTFRQFICWYLLLVLLFSICAKKIKLSDQNHNIHCVHHHCFGVALRELHSYTL